MPDTQTPKDYITPHQMNTLKVALYALIFGTLITLFKLTAYLLTGSVAILSDTLESTINIAAAAVMLYSIWYASRPADKTHPYGHGKIEFLAVGFEGILILFAAIFIAFTAIKKLISGPASINVNIGLGFLFIIGLLTAGLAYYVSSRGKKLNNQILIADGKHLITDVLSTLGVFLGLILVKLTGWLWLDPIIAIIIAAIIFPMSWRLLWQSLSGLMDRSDPADLKRIHEILDREVKAASITSYHKVRVRHTGSYHWVDMHLQVDPTLTVAQSHTLASAIEYKIEQALTPANATAHVEPSGAYCEHNPQSPPPPPYSSDAPSKPALEPARDDKASAQPIDESENLEPIDLAPPRNDTPPPPTTPTSKPSPPPPPAPAPKNPDEATPDVFTVENAITGSGDLYELAHEEASPLQEEQESENDPTNNYPENITDEESDDDFNAPNPNA
ncbi:Ferrous-iron efflux pump FieF [Poriferisphaera corsica]|uniref:Ferrous-iron efflux pump FieF n=1 Tax=Poriferisphaera corsica TaxID=2528020 RepID=A0A517YX53_9BACT|nr:cation diffusion facilitator family transporter [Poriferisphaera corsica]QDU34796.1 Ferrous-iron efflux pump FieF [Poriferisphaera corsica]